MAWTTKTLQIKIGRLRFAKSFFLYPWNWRHLTHPANPNWTAELRVSQSTETRTYREKIYIADWLVHLFEWPAISLYEDRGLLTTWTVARDKADRKSCAWKKTRDGQLLYLRTNWPLPTWNLVAWNGALARGFQCPTIQAVIIYKYEKANVPPLKWIRGLEFWKLLISIIR